MAARSAYGSRTRFAWVRAHTGCQDFASRLNHRADRAANRGRLLYHADGRHFPRSAARFDWMEEDVLFLTPEGQFLGRPRTYLAAAHRRGKVEEWRRLPVQGELLRDGGCPDAILGQARALRKFRQLLLLCSFSWASPSGYTHTTGCTKVSRSAREGVRFASKERMRRSDTCLPILPEGKYASAPLKQCGTSSPVWDLVSPGAPLCTRAWKDLRSQTLSHAWLR